MNKKARIELIKDKAEEFIPKGFYCASYGQKECPFLQFRKQTNNRWKLIEVGIPYGNKYFQYCSYLRKYLSIQDCIKDCGINEDYEEGE